MRTKSKRRSNSREVKETNRKLILSGYDGTQAEKERQFYDDMNVLRTCCTKTPRSVRTTANQYVGDSNFDMIWIEDRAKYLDALGVSRGKTPDEINERFMEITVRDAVDLYEKIGTEIERERTEE